MVRMRHRLFWPRPHAQRPRRQPALRGREAVAKRGGALPAARPGLARHVVYSAAAVAAAAAVQVRLSERARRHHGRLWEHAEPP